MPPRPTRTRTGRSRSPKALQGLIHAASDARDPGQAALPAAIAAPLVKAFRHGVILGLGQVKKTGRKGGPFRELLKCLRDRHDDVLRFVHDLRIPPTSNQANGPAARQNPAENLRPATF